MADLKTTASFDDSQVDAGLARMDRKFKATGERIEKSTEGVRKFAGALSSTAGIVTGVLGVVTLVAGAVGTVVSLTQKWKQEQEEVAQRARDTFQRIEEIRAKAADFGKGAFNLGGAEELEALNRLQELRTTGALRTNAFGFSAAEIAAAREEEEALLALIEKIRAARASAAAQDRIARSAAREQEFARQQEQLRMIEEREAAERRAAEEAAKRERERQQALEREADQLRRQIEIDNLRARGLDDQAEALERQRDLQRTIRSIEEAEGLSPDERRDLIRQARETAEFEEAAARAKADAARAEDRAREAGGRTTTTGLAAGLAAGNALVQSQVFGRGGTPAEQQQLAESRKQTSLQQQVKDLIERLVSEPRLVA